MSEEGCSDVKYVVNILDFTEAGEREQNSTHEYVSLA